MVPVTEEEYFGFECATDVAFGASGVDIAESQSIDTIHPRPLAVSVSDVRHWNTSTPCAGSSVNRGANSVSNLEKPPAVAIQTLQDLVEAGGGRGDRQEEIRNHLRESILAAMEAEVNSKNECGSGGVRVPTILRG
jgi:hypothetical protein